VLQNSQRWHLKCKVIIKSHLEEEIKMKKIISTIVAVALISGTLATSAHAGGRHGGGINPLWIPVAVLSTLAAVTIAQPPPVVYERQVYYEPRPTVIYEEPRQTVIYREPRYYSHEQHYDRGPSNYYNERDRAYEAPRYRDYR
jgi:Ni/Co efflux regulator RcnB